MESVSNLHAEVCPLNTLLCCQISTHPVLSVIYKTTHWACSSFLTWQCVKQGEHDNVLNVVLKEKYKI
jgi:hypothetical protein